MRILSVDTTGTSVCIALSNAGKIFSIERDIKLKNYESTICLIKSLLKKSKLNIRQIDYFGVCVGPGSFTGIRIGISTMKALAYCLNKPLIGYKNLDLHAWMAKDKFCGLLCVIQDAKRGNIYSSVFSNNRDFQRVSSYLLCDISQLMKKLRCLNRLSHRCPNLYFYGDITSEYKEDIKRDFPTSVILPKKDGSSKTQAMISLIKNSLGEKGDSFNLLPFYMYPRDCQVSPVRNSIRASQDSLRKLSLIPQGGYFRSVRKKISNGVRKITS